MTKPTQEEIEALIQAAYDGTIDPYDNNVMETMSVFCDDFVAELVAQTSVYFSYEDYSYSPDKADFLSEDVSAERLEALKAGAKPDAYEVELFGLSVWNQEWVIGGSDLCIGSLYRLSAPESSSEKRVVWFISVDHTQYGAGHPPAGPLTSLDAVGDHIKDLYYEGFEILEDFPEKDEIEKLNQNAFNTNAYISEEFLKSLEENEVGGGEPG